MIPGIGTFADHDRETRKMTKTFNPREMAASLAGAFIAAMLFVSAAVGPLPIA